MKKVIFFIGIFLIGLFLFLWPENSQAVICKQTDSSFVYNGELWLIGETKPIYEVDFCVYSSKSSANFDQIIEGAKEEQYQWDIYKNDEAWIEYWQDNKWQATGLKDVAANLVFDSIDAFVKKRYVISFKIVSSNYKLIIKPLGAYFPEKHVKQLDCEDIKDKLQCLIESDFCFWREKENGCFSIEEQSICIGLNEELCNSPTSNFCYWDHGFKECRYDIAGEIDPVKGESQKEYQESAFKLPDVSDLNQLGTTNVTEVLGRVIKMVLGIAGSIALLMFVYGGVVIMSGSTTVVGGASKRDIAKGQGILVWSAMGLLVIFASYAIVDFIFKAFQ